MKKSKFSDEQIAFVLMQAETGTRVQKVIRQKFKAHKKARTGGLDGGCLPRQRPAREPGADDCAIELLRSAASP